MQMILHCALHIDPHSVLLINYIFCMYHPKYSVDIAQESLRYFGKDFISHMRITNSTLVMLMCRVCSHSIILIQILRIYSY